jgi:hypothetical protein
MTASRALRSQAVFDAVDRTLRLTLRGSFAPWHVRARPGRGVVGGIRSIERGGRSPCLLDHRPRLTRALPASYFACGSDIESVGSSNSLLTAIECQSCATRPDNLNHAPLLVTLQRGDPTSPPLGRLIARTISAAAFLT